MGFREKPPAQLQGPCASRLVFVAGHFTLFFTGLSYLLFPAPVHLLCIVLAMLVAVKNGATFYITYFWRVYESQILAFERQMVQVAEACATAEAQAQEPS